MLRPDVKGRALVLTGTLVVLALIFLPPFLGVETRSVVMAVFSGVCHQLADRSPHIGGVQLAVCHRCLGVYVGLPAAALVYAIANRFVQGRGISIPLVLGASVLPMIIDWTGDFAGLWTNTPGSRFVTGLVFGLAAGMVLVSTVVETVARSTRRH